MSSVLEILAFGGLSIQYNGVLMHNLASRKAEALLIYLLATGRVYQREVLADFLWGDAHSTDRALSNLRVVLTGMRHQLGPYLEITRQTIRFSHNLPYTFDVTHLERGLAEVLPLIRRGIPNRAQLDRLAQYLTLYKGDFLDGFILRGSQGFDEWLSAERERLHRLVTDALHDLVRGYLAIEEYQSGIEHANLLLKLDPLREDAHRLLMTLLARSGRFTAALEQYEQCRIVLQRELGLAPDEETAALYQKIRDRQLGRESSGPGRAGAVYPPLPAYPTILIGRAAEVARLGAMIRNDGCRLVSLIGPGGIGKTRLALAIAAELFEQRVTDVVFVPLASLSNPGLVVPTIAQVLGVQDRSDRPMIDRVIAALRDRQPILLILDNFESVQAAAPRVSELLMAVPGLKVLVTSQAMLHLYGEYVFVIPPLDTGINGWATVNRTADSQSPALPAAIQLFVERAQAVNIDFPMNPDTQGDVAEICRRLDGLPLAIELAAARTQTFSAGELLARLDEYRWMNGLPLGLLADGPIDAPLRHQAVRNTVSWSYVLLTPAEQRLFRHMGVLIGGGALSAVTHLYTHSDTPVEARNLELGELLASLIAKNLVRQALGPLDEPRYMMLEAIRAYALDRLADAGELEHVRRHHAMFFLQMAETTEPDKASSIMGLDADLDNMRAALAWALDTESIEEIQPTRPKIGLRLATALSWFWGRRGYWETEQDWIYKALERAGQGLHTSAAASAQLSMANLLWLQGQRAMSEVVHHQALALYREIGDLKGSADALHSMAILAREQGEADRAQVLLEESLALFEEQYDHTQAAWVRCTLAGVLIMKGEPKPAEVLLKKSLPVFRASHVTLGVAWVLNHLGHVAQLRGDYRRAQAVQSESLALFRGIDKGGTAWALHGLADAAFHQGDLAQAVEQFIKSMLLFRDLREPKGVSWCLAGLAQLAGAQGRGVEDAHLAACLLGASQAIRNTHNVRAAPGVRNEEQLGIISARVMLGAEAFDAALRAGQALTMEQALTEALDAFGWPV